MGGDGMGMDGRCECNRGGGAECEVNNGWMQDPTTDLVEGVHPLLSQSHYTVKTMHDVLLNALKRTSARTL